jgi:RNA polymerase sigma-70 factor (ECF subfamily)
MSEEPLAVIDAIQPTREGDSDDHELARAARQDHAAFEQLYRRYVDRVYRYCYVHTGDSRDAEDLTAQTFLAAFEGIGRYHRRGSVAAWLFGIAWRKCNDYHRRRYRQMRAPLAEADALDDPAAPDLDETVTEQRLLDCVQKVLGSLSADRREALRLRFWGGLSTAEIAEVMGRREGAVKMLVSRAVGDLRARCLHEE